MVACARGGNGGAGGFALRNYFDTFHRLCGIQSHMSSNFVVPGGANDESGNIGDEIILGAQGGYGVSMPTAIQFDLRDWTVSGIRKTYPSEFDTYTFNKNLAPNIPDSWGIDKLRLPYGTLNRFGNVNVSNIFKKYESNSYSIPNKPAPTGGGGGCGVSFQGIDQRPISTYTNVQSTADPNKNIVEWFAHNIGFTNDTVPNDYFQKWSNFVTGSIVLGLGGTNSYSGYLIDEIDENGVEWKFPELGWNNYRGGDGGYGFYGIQTDNVYGNTQPTVGSYYGFGGGGGGARFVLNHGDKYNTTNESTYPTKGQDGANGADGFAIVIIEGMV
jgi:hypothetical protein